MPGSVENILVPHWYTCFSLELMLKYIKIDPPRYMEKRTVNTERGSLFPAVNVVGFGI